MCPAILLGYGGQPIGSAIVLRVYAHPASQPSRSVIWSCVLNNLPIELKTPNPDDDEAISPRGQIPIIVDDGFVLYEMPAILTYLATKHGWSEMWPDDVAIQARISQYMHEHHSLTRLATTTFMAPHVLVAFGGDVTSNPLSYISSLCVQTAMDEKSSIESTKLIQEIVEYIETAYLKHHRYIAGTSGPTLADVACYEELGQLDLANLFDFSEYPVTQGWISRMRDLPYHDELHRFNLELGDISTTPNTMERFSSAVDHAMQSLVELDGVNVS